MSSLKKYLITDPKYFTNNPKNFKEILEKIFLKHSISMACFRDKESTNFEDLAKIFLDVSRQFQIENIFINSDITLAKSLNFDGVHLTSLQFDLIDYAKNLNLKTVISCHNFDDLKLAEEKKVDFVTYSPIFNSPNKPKPLGIENLKSAINHYKKLKIIALGGIISQNEIMQIENCKAYGFASIRYFV